MRLAAVQAQAAARRTPLAAFLLSPPSQRTSRRYFASCQSRSAPINRTTASRDVLARYAPGAPPIASASDVPLEALLDRSTLSPAASAVPASLTSNVAERPSGQFKSDDRSHQVEGRPSPDRPRVEMQDVLTPSQPAKGAGPMTIAGVDVPVKPERPGDEDCCMSGCAICIYDIYAESLLEYNTAVRAARKALLESAAPRSSWPAAVIEMDVKLQARKERAARRAAARQQATPNEQAQAVVEDKAADEMDDTLEDMDPTMRAFLELEGKLNKAKQVAAKGG